MKINGLKVLFQALWSISRDKELGEMVVNGLRPHLLTGDVKLDLTIQRGDENGRKD